MLNLIQYYLIFSTYSSLIFNIQYIFKVCQRPHNVLRVTGFPKTQDPIQDYALHLTDRSPELPLIWNSSFAFVFHDINMLEEYKPVTW